MHVSQYLAKCCEFKSESKDSNNNTQQITHLFISSCRKLDFRILEVFFRWIFVELQGVQFILCYMRENHAR